MEAVLPVHAAATWFMTGVIWFVQIVHYPLMARVGVPGFAVYEEEHARRTTWVVAPPMLIEAATAVALVTVARSVADVRQAWLGLALVVVVWLSTAVAQAPQHRRLQRGFDPRALRRLVGSNWLRVAAWSGRSLLVAFGLC